MKKTDKNNRPGGLLVPEEMNPGSGLRESMTVGGSVCGYEPSGEDIAEFYNLLGFGLWRLRWGRNRAKKFEFNNKLMEMIGICSVERVPESLDDFISNYIHPDDWAEVTHPLSECLNNNQLKTAFEHRLLNKTNGQWRWVKTVIRSRPKNPADLERIVLGATLDIHLLYQALNPNTIKTRANGRQISDLPPGRLYMTTPGAANRG